MLRGSGYIDHTGLWPEDSVLGVVGAVLLLSGIWLFCNPIDCSPPSSSVHGIIQARMLDQIPFPSPGNLPDPGMEASSPALAGGFFTTELWGKPSVLIKCCQASPHSSLPLCSPCPTVKPRFVAVLGWVDVEFSHAHFGKVWMLPTVTFPTLQLQ